MKHYSVPMLRGVIKDMHPRLIPDTKASDVNNIMFREESFQSRWGYGTYGGNLPLNGAILAIELFRRNTGDMILCAFTKRDAYYLEQATSLWKYFTRSYITGTASVSGTKNVVGVGTTWLTTWDSRSIYQIKFGNNDVNGTGTWHTIDQITGNTTLTLDANATGSGNYVLRLCFTGEDVDIPSIAYPYDTTGTQDKILVVTNGVDPVLRWDGGLDVDETLRELEGSPPIAKYVSFFGSKGFAHTILSWLVDGVDNYPQKIEFSNSGYPTEWDSIAYYNFFDTQDEIVGIRALQTRMILYKKESMTEMWVNVTGGNDDPIDYNENKIRDIGTPSIRTVHDFGSYHIFLGWDNVYLFDGVAVTPIGTDLINTMIKESNRAYLDIAFALPILSEYLYCLFIPTGDNTYCDKCFVYNYRQKFWTIWDLSHTIDDDLKAIMVSQGYTYKETSPIWSSLVSDDFEVTGNITSGSNVLTITSYPSGYSYTDIVLGMQVIGTGIGTGSVGHHTLADALVGNTVTLTGNAISSVTGGTFRILSGLTWDNWDTRWKDLLLYDDNLTYLLGDSDGYIYDIAPEYTVDRLLIDSAEYNADIECSITTKDYPLNDPKHTFKLCELIVGMIRFASGDLIIRASVDFGTNWSAWLTIPNTPEQGDAFYVEHIANFVQRGRQVRFQLQNVDGADFEIESLIIGFNDDNGRVSQSNI